MTNNSKPLVTIGVLAYNRPDMLRNALDCLIKQSYENLEIIVSDDCSPNQEVANVGEEYQSTDYRLRFFRQPENLDAVRNHWFLLEQATGKYFMWAYDDDLYDERLVEKLVEHMEANANTLLCISDVNIIDDNDIVTRVEKLTRLRPSESWLSARRKFFFYPTSNIYLACLGMFRVEPMKKRGLKPELGCMGYNTSMEVPFLAKVSLAGEIRSIEDALIYYRSHEDSRYIKEMARISLITEALINLCIRSKLLSSIVASELSVKDQCSYLFAVLNSWVISIPYRLGGKLLSSRIKKKIKSRLRLED